jgi:hypothetical protein
MIAVIRLGVAIGYIGLSAVIALAGETRWIELNENKCGRCHRVYDPESFTKRGWNQALLSMKAQAGLSEEEYEGLASLVESDENADQAATEGPQLGGYLYTEYFQSEEKASNYDLHYLAIHVSGWSGNKVEYLGEFEFEHGGKGDNAFVEQAWMDYWFHPNVALKIGALLTPFNRFDEIHEPLSNPLVTRPQVARELGVSAWKDVGVNLHGYVRPNEQLFMEFDLYSINGLGAGTNLRGSRQYRDNNEDKAFGARVSAVIHDSYEFGLSSYRGAWDDEGELELNILGLHARLRTPIAKIHAEYTKARSENPSPIDDGDMNGFFIQAQRQVHSKLNLVLRWGELDYLDPGSELGRTPEKGNKDLSELALGFSFSPDPNVILKLEYNFKGEGERLEQVDNDQLGLQAAVRF